MDALDRDGGSAFSEFSDPRLVAIYDTVNPISEYRAFYLDLASRLSAEKIVDVGCGTGLLIHGLARRGRSVIGVEPSGAMLDIARRRPDSEQVRWIEGDARQLGEVGADLALMTGHVAQIIRDDEDLSSTFQAIHGALRPGGHLAFESRNPLFRHWEAWNPQASRRKVVDPAMGRIEVWLQNTEVDGDLVRGEIHYLFERSGEELVSHGELRFRTREELTLLLSDAGFSVEKVVGDWDGRPADAASREMIFISARG